MRQLLSFSVLAALVTIVGTLGSPASAHADEPFHAPIRDIEVTIPYHGDAAKQAPGTSARMALQVNPFAPLVTALTAGELWVVDFEAIFAVDDVVQIAVEPVAIGLTFLGTSAQAFGGYLGVRFALDGQGLGDGWWVRPSLGALGGDATLVGGLVAVGHQWTWESGFTTGIGGYIGAVGNVESGDTFVTPGLDGKMGFVF